MIPAAVFCVFLGLKLSSAITWSWWAVTAPLWGLIDVKRD